METANQGDASPETAPENDQNALELLDGKLVKKLEQCGFFRVGQGGEFVRPPIGVLPKISLSIKQFRQYWLPHVPKYRQISTGQITWECTINSVPGSVVFFAYHGGQIYDTQELVSAVQRYLTAKESQMLIEANGRAY